MQDLNWYDFAKHFLVHHPLDSLWKLKSNFLDCANANQKEKAKTWFRRYDVCAYECEEIHILHILKIQHTWKRKTQPRALLLLLLLLLLFISARLLAWQWFLKKKLFIIDNKLFPIIGGMRNHVLFSKNILVAGDKWNQSRH